MFGALKVFSTHSRATVVTWEEWAITASFICLWVPVIGRLHFCLFSPWCADIFSAFEFPPSCLPFEAILLSSTELMKSKRHESLKKRRCFQAKSGTISPKLLSRSPHLLLSPAWSLPGEDNLFLQAFPLPLLWVRLQVLVLCNENQEPVHAAISNARISCGKEIISTFWENFWAPDKLWNITKNHQIPFAIWSWFKSQPHGICTSLTDKFPSRKATLAFRNPACPGSFRWS